MKDEIKKIYYCTNTMWNCNKYDYQHSTGISVHLSASKTNPVVTQNMCMPT